MKKLQDSSLQGSRKDQAPKFKWWDATHGRSAWYLNLGELLRAMRTRPKFAEEDWLVLITTDHGGRGNSHGGDSDAERNIWLIAHGRKLPRESLLTQPTGQTALVPMIYRHLGITAKPAWNPPVPAAAPAPTPKP